MSRQIVACLLLIVSLLSLAEQARAEAPLAVSTESKSISDDDLRAAFQKEYAYLVSLRDGLKKQKSEIEAKLKSRAQELEGEVKSLQLANAKMAAVTDERVQAAMELEKRLKSGGGATAFESALRDARARIQELKDRANGRLSEKKTMKVSADVDGFESFLKLIEQGLAVGGELATPRQQAGSFLSLDDQPLQGSIVHWGGVAAFGLWNGKAFVLAPDGKGRLKAVRESQLQNVRSLVDGESVPRLSAYFFRTLSERPELNGSLNAAERFAGLLPILYLILIATTVGGLFVAIAKP